MFLVYESLFWVFNWTFKEGKKVLYLSVQFLAFKRQVNKNFNQIDFYVRKLFIVFFSVKTKVYSVKFQEIIAKILFPEVFHYFRQEIFFPRSTFKVPVKTISQPFMNRKVAFRLMAKQANNVINYQNGLRLRRMQVRCFHNRNAYKLILAEIHSNLSIN